MPNLTGPRSIRIRPCSALSIDPSPIALQHAGLFSSVLPDIQKMIRRWSQRSPQGFQRDSVS